jgi:hypothetical protein
VIGVLAGSGGSVIEATTASKRTTATSSFGGVNIQTLMDGSVT